MESTIAAANDNNIRPHVVCVPYPSQGHITPMLKLAKLFHNKGFHITFVNSEHNHHRFLEARCPTALDGLPDFRFATIPDGLPSDAGDTQDTTAALSESASSKTCFQPLYEMLLNINQNSGPESTPPVSCIIADGSMCSITLRVAEALGVPEVPLWPASACGLLGYTRFKALVENGFAPLRDMSQVTDGYLETIVDSVPGMKDIRLKDIPTLLRTKDPDLMLNFIIQEVEAMKRCRFVIINTYDTLEHDVLHALSSMFSSIYTIGPLQLMMNNVQDTRLDVMYSNLLKEDTNCLKWLDDKEPGSVLYVNFGSTTVVTTEQLSEFAWGLANSKKTFLWIIRPDLVAGDSAMVPPEFVTETKDRSMLASLCDQEQVLQHPAIGGFLTHSGWNSTLESIAGGVPMICWPFFAEQHTNSRYSCAEWGIGMEIDNDVKRDEVEVQVKELMDGDKGKKMKERATEWKRKAEEATAPGGSSYLNFDNLINELAKM